MSNARFAILQARAVKDKRISDSQFRTLAALGMYADEDGWCYPSLATIGKDLGKSKQAVGRDTIALKKLKYLEVHARFKEDGSRRSNLYRLKFDLPPRQRDVDAPSTSEVDAPSTSEVDVNDPLNAPFESVINAEPSNDEIKAMLDIFRDRFGKFHGEGELKRWVVLCESTGIDKVIEIAEWALKKEIHLENRAGLLDSMETASKNWRASKKNWNGNKSNNSKPPKEDTFMQELEQARKAFEKESQ